MGISSQKLWIAGAGAGVGANSSPEALDTERSFDDGLMPFLRLSHFSHCYLPDLTDENTALGPYL